MITLPWPDKRLSPNARLHWRPKAEAKAIARDWAFKLTLADMHHAERMAVRLSEGHIPVRITFYPPDARHRDDDNMVGSFKAYRDGIADALGINDRCFRPEYVFADPCPPGRVEVEITMPESVANCEKTSRQPLLNYGVSGKESGPESVEALNPALTTNDEVTSHGS